MVPEHFEQVIVKGRSLRRPSHLILTGIKIGRVHAKRADPYPAADTVALEVWLFLRLSSSVRSEWTTHELRQVMAVAAPRTSVTS